MGFPSGSNDQSDVNNQQVVIPSMLEIDYQTVFHGSKGISCPTEMDDVTWEKPSGICQYLMWLRGTYGAEGAKQIRSNVGISKKSHINYHCHFITFVGLFCVTLNFLNTLLPSTWYTCSGTGAFLTDFTKALFCAFPLRHRCSPKLSSFSNNGITCCTCRLILVWLHVFINLFCASSVLMITQCGKMAVVFSFHLVQLTEGRYAQDSVTPLAQGVST